MRSTNPFPGMLNEWTVAAILLSPFLFQYVKWVALKITRAPELSKRLSAVLHSVTVAAVICWQGWAIRADALTITTQVALGLVFSEQVYKRGVEPMANSANPLVPRTATPKEAKAELGEAVKCDPPTLTEEARRP